MLLCSHTRPAGTNPHTEGHGYGHEGEGRGAAEYGAHDQVRAEEAGNRFDEAAGRSGLRPRSQRFCHGILDLALSLLDSEM